MREKHRNFLSFVVASIFQSEDLSILARNNSLDLFALTTEKKIPVTPTQKVHLRTRRPVPRVNRYREQNSEPDQVAAPLLAKQSCASDCSRGRKSHEKVKCETAVTQPRALDVYYLVD